MLFILLASLTDDGLQDCAENPDAFADACNSVDVQLLARYATLGQYDFVVLVEADNAQCTARLSVVLGAEAGVHIESMQATTAHLMAERPEILVRSEETEFSCQRYQGT